MSVNRSIIKKALTLLLSKDLIVVKYLKKGIQYKKNDNTNSIASYFESEYSKQLDQRAKWLCSTFDGLTDSKLSQLVEANTEKWGSEFSVVYFNGESKYG